MASKEKLTETDIQQLCRIRASELGAVVFRNNTGMLRNQNGAPVTYGLCKGSSDLIGWFKGRFLAIEVKRPGKKPTKAQECFIEKVKADGGIAGVATCPDDINRLLGA